MTRQPTAGVDDDAVWTATDRERLDLADVLEGLSDEQWAQPSLCSGWRVRDVAAHLALAHTPLVPAIVTMVRARGSFDRMVRETAVRHATAPTSQLVAEIRGMAGSRRHAPGITCLEPLVDALVHGQDIAIPLGRPRTMPVEAAATAATRVWGYRWPMSNVFRAHTRLRGLELVATDVDWSVGQGARVEGPIQSLLLLLTGRTGSVRLLGGAGLRHLDRTPR